VRGPSIAWSAPLAGFGRTPAFKFWTCETPLTRTRRRGRAQSLTPLPAGTDAADRRATTQTDWSGYSRDASARRPSSKDCGFYALQGIQLAQAAASRDCGSAAEAPQEQCIWVRHSRKAWGQERLTHAGPCSCVEEHGPKGINRTRGFNCFVWAVNSVWSILALR
jgi:hypothetical protein